MYMCVYDIQQSWNFSENRALWLKAPGLIFSFHLSSIIIHHSMDIYFYHYSKNRKLYKSSQDLLEVLVVIIKTMHALFVTSL